MTSSWLLLAAVLLATFSSSAFPAVAATNADAGGGRGPIVHNNRGGNHQVRPAADPAPTFCTVQTMPPNNSKTDTTGSAAATPATTAGGGGGGIRICHAAPEDDRGVRDKVEADWEIALVAVCVICGILFASLSILRHRLKKRRLRENALMADRQVALIESQAQAASTRAALPSVAPDESTFGLADEVESLMDELQEREKRKREEGDDVAGHHRGGDAGATSIHQVQPMMSTSQQQTLHSQQHRSSFSSNRANGSSSGGILSVPSSAAATVHSAAARAGGVGGVGSASFASNKSSGGSKSVSFAST